MLLFILFILFAFSFLEIQKKRVDYLFYFIIICLILLDSVKLASGTDYYFYFNDYKKYIENINYESRYEPIYSQLSKNSAIWRVPYHLFLFGFYSIYYFLIGYTIKRYSPYPILSVFLFFCITIGLMGSNRQLMAMAIIFFTTFVFSEIKNNYKYIFFVFAIILASGFHYSAILCLPIVFFNRKITERVWFSIFIIVLLLLLLNFNSYIVFNIDEFIPIEYSDLINKYRSTKNVITPISTNIFFGVIRRGILIFIFILCRDKLETFSFYRILYNISWFSLIFYICFYTMPFIGSRAGIYFLVFESIGYIMIIKSINSQKSRLLIMFLILIFGVFLFFKNISIYAHLFIPYKTIFGVF